jgi:hypothetical protein
MNYEEIIKNVKQLSNLAEWYESDVISDGYEEAKKHREDMTRRVIKFIEKEHELLGLYQKASHYQIGHNLGCLSVDDKKKWIEIEKQVDDLEKELEEMK